ncbi:MAG: ATPase, partial [Verrucomicrobiaceae bacterium]
MSRDHATDRFATLKFQRSVAAPVGTLYAAWTSPAARAVWSAPAPTVTVEFLEADSRVGAGADQTARAAGD